jgi:PKD repeat protein
MPFLSGETAMTRRRQMALWGVFFGTVMLAGVAHAAAPTITSITPVTVTSNGNVVQGSTFGGTDVTIVGLNFVSNTRVTFGGVDAIAVSLDVYSNSPSIRCVTPAGTLGNVDVSVINPDGLSATATGAFKYIQAPTILGLSLTEAPISGGSVILISGNGFVTSNANVRLNGIAASNIVVNSTTSITCTLPRVPSVSYYSDGNYYSWFISIGASSDSVSASRRSLGYNATGGIDFKLVSPPFIGVHGLVPTVGGLSIPIQGNSSLPYHVNIDGVEITDVTLTAQNGYSHWQFILPPHAAGAVTITVTDAYGQRSEDVFTYIVFPTITSVTPVIWTPGTPITITGTGFVTNAPVDAPVYVSLTSYLGDNSHITNVVVNSPTSITCTPVGYKGFVSVEIANPDGGSVFAPNIFGVKDTLSPSGGYVSGGASITFQVIEEYDSFYNNSYYPGSVTSVSFGGVAATHVSDANEGNITCATPAHSAGSVDVVVTFADGSKATGPKFFTYYEPTAPVITSPLTAAAAIGDSFSYKITVVDKPGLGESVMFSAKNLPVGIVLQQTTGSTEATLSGTLSVAGVTDITLIATNQFGVDTKKLHITVSKASGGGNTAPAFTSNPTATPALANAGDTVSFTASATDADGDMLYFTWDFGDGSTGIGASASHVYTAAGHYTVKCNVTDGTDTTTRTVNVAINDAGGTGQDASQFHVLKALFKFNFAAKKKDSMSMSGSIPVPSNFSPTDKIVVLDIGNYEASFTLDAKGKGKTASGDIIALAGKLKSGVYQTGVVKFVYVIKNANLFETLSDEGFGSDTVSGDSVDIPVLLSIDGDAYLDTLTVKYSAKKGKSGSGKKIAE